VLVTVYDAEPSVSTDTVVRFRCRDNAGRIVYICVTQHEADELAQALQLGRLPQLEVGPDLRPLSDDRMILPR